MPNKINAIKIKNNLICLEAKGPISKTHQGHVCLLQVKLLKKKFYRLVFSPLLFLLIFIFLELILFARSCMSSTKSVSSTISYPRIVSIISSV